MPDLGQCVGAVTTEEGAELIRAALGESGLCGQNMNRNEALRPFPVP